MLNEYITSISIKWNSHLRSFEGGIITDSFTTESSINEYLNTTLDKAIAYAIFHHIKEFTFDFIGETYYANFNERISIWEFRKITKLNYQDTNY